MNFNNQDQKLDEFRTSLETISSSTLSFHSVRTHLDTSAVSDDSRILSRESLSSVIVRKYCKKYIYYSKFFCLFNTESYGHEVYKKNNILREANS